MMMSLGCCKVSTPLNGVMVNEAAAGLPTYMTFILPSYKSAGLSEDRARTTC